MPVKLYRHAPLVKRLVLWLSEPRPAELTVADCRLPVAGVRGPPRDMKERCPAFAALCTVHPAAAAVECPLSWMTSSMPRPLAG